MVRRPDADLAETCLQLTAAAEVLARVVDAAGPAERGAHDWGLADASGFAGMGCAELLLHTGDVAMDRRLDWTPPSRLAEVTRARLFPWAPADADPWAALLWAHRPRRAARPGAGHLLALALRPAVGVGRHPAPVR
ncbi:hypothetical protein [Modestobacter sp. VKM Ac-2984]|uniref:hypothetical protein n=1 Tax=Modestobacter sp. VKM Ac-2984 TaxID=3004138 RepID=UPI0022AACE73|nr:hypothetical protein [Modestobacter sp. VKM Ac-2984]MCZ2815021.1 hypothetical protein [Modestobacter sp. VKM Ac-2984]